MRPLLLLAALTALAPSACYSPGDGLAPPLQQLYFPTGLALDTSNTPPLSMTGDDGVTALNPDYVNRYDLDFAPKYLYAASSDFDLQYRSSGLISFDLKAISKAVPHTCASSDDCCRDSDICPNALERCDTLENARSVANLPDSYVPSYVCVPEDTVTPCGDLGEQGADNRLLYPGRCNPFDLKKHPEFIHDQVGIGAFATNVIFAHSDPAAGDVKSRLFLPVRGDATLHWIDVDNNGNLNCDQQTTGDDSCGASHRAGRDPAASNDNISQPAEPFGIAITEAGDYLAVTNQTSGSVSLYTHDWESAVGPQLVSLVTNLPQAPVAVAAVPPVLEPGTPYAPAPGFLVAYRNAAQIDLLRVRDDDVDSPGETNYSRYALTYAGSSAIAVNSLGYDSRDIVIDDNKRKTGCEKVLASSLDPSSADYLDCLRAGPQPDIYVANRAPSSLLVGSTTPDPSYASGSSDLPAFTDSISLTTGPSRVVLGWVRVPPIVGHVRDATHGLVDDKTKQYDLEPRVFIVCFDSTRIFVYDPTRHAVDSIIDTGRGPYAFVVDSQRGLGYVAFFTDSYLGVVSLDQRHAQTYATVIANIGTPTPPRTSK